MLGWKKERRLLSKDLLKFLEDGDKEERIRENLEKSNKSEGVSESTFEGTMSEITSFSPGGMAFMWCRKVLNNLSKNEKREG